MGGILRQATACLPTDGSATASARRTIHHHQQGLTHSNSAEAESAAEDA
jgi:hypothetical protein